MQHVIDGFKPLGKAETNPTRSISIPSIPQIRKKEIAKDINFAEAFLLTILNVKYMKKYTITGNANDSIITVNLSSPVPKSKVKITDISKIVEKTIEIILVFDDRFLNSFITNSFLSFNIYPLHNLSSFFVGNIGEVVPIFQQLSCVG